MTFQRFFHSRLRSGRGLLERATRDPASVCVCVSVLNSQIEKLQINLEPFWKKRKENKNMN